MWFNGRISVSKTEDIGSIPVALAITMRSGSRWLARQAHNLKVGGSSPISATITEPLKLSFNKRSHGGDILSGYNSAGRGLRLGRRSRGFKSYCPDQRFKSLTIKILYHNKL